MTNFELVKQKLILVPQFRERSKRGHFLFILTMKELGVIPHDTLVKGGDRLSITVGTPSEGSVTNDFGKVYGNFERAWRQVLAEDENKHLRGSDYGDGETLSQEKQLELGYVPGFEQTMKDLEKITVKELPMSAVNVTNADKLHSNI